MKKKNNKQVEDFLKEAKFSDAVFKDLFLELVTKYKDDSPRQSLIRAVVLLFERKYPEEMEAFKKDMKRVKETRMNEFAANKENDQRLLFKFPQSLWARFAMLVQDPPFLQQSNPPTKEELAEMEWVMKTFPEFTVAEKF